MTDTTHVTDLLPDLLHERLDARTRASVESHLVSCESCRDELDLLKVARNAVVAPRVDAVRISNAIPAYAATRRRRIVAIAWKIAAAIIVVAGGATLFARTAGEPAKQMSEFPAKDSSAVVLPNPVRVAESMKVATKPTPAAKPAELATGETLHDLSESELRSLLREIAALDGMTSSETEVVIPSVGKGTQ
jgi:hypothetical protein